MNEKQTAKEIFYSEVLNYKTRQEIKLYKIMQVEPGKIWTSEDVARIFGINNIASRLFRAIQLSGRIVSIGQVESSKGTLINGYKIVNEELDLTIEDLDVFTEKKEPTDEEVRELTEYILHCFLRDKVKDWELLRNMSLNYVSLLIRLNQGDKILEIKLKDHIKSRGGVTTIKTSGIDILKELEWIFQH